MELCTILRVQRPISLILQESRLLFLEDLSRPRVFFFPVSTILILVSSLNQKSCTVPPLKKFLLGITRSLLVKLRLFVQVCLFFSRKFGQSIIAWFRFLVCFYNRLGYSLIPFCVNRIIIYLKRNFCICPAV